MYKGIIVENSLADKSILDKLQIVRTWQDGSWTLHEVQVEKAQLSEIGKYLADGPWYLHFWKQGEDNIRVVYKDKMFDIKFSDKSTWQDAIEYGKLIGIPDKQLTFSIN